MAEDEIAHLERDDAEHPIPSEWRTIFRRIVDAFVEGDLELRNHVIQGVDRVEPSTAESIAANISAHGDALAPLHPTVWEYAVYRWMNGYWQVIIDLTTSSEPVSDLALHCKLYDSARPSIEICSVHVP